MKNLLLFVVLLFPLFVHCQTEDQKELKQRKTLIWHDEFDYQGLPDPKKWNFEEGLVRNNEPQYLLINLALISGQPGIDDSIFPVDFAIDYVRIYQFE